MPVDLSVFDELEAMSKRETAFAFDEGGNRVPPKEEKKEEKKPDAKVQEPEVEKDDSEKEEEPEAEEEVVEEGEDTEESAPAGDQALREKLMGLLASIQQELPTSSPEEKPAPKDEAPKPKSFVTDEDLEDLTATKLNDKLNLVYQQAQQDALRAVSQTVGKVVSDAIDVRMTVSEFYRDNSDLVKYKPVVSLVVSSLQKQHPEWNIGQVVQELGKEVRTVLGLSPSGEVKKNKPGFAKQPGGSRKVVTTPQKKATGVQADIKELIERRSR